MGVDEEPQDEVRAAMVMFDEVSQRLAFLEGDHGQQAIAGECQMESGGFSASRAGLSFPTHRAET